MRGYPHHRARVGVSQERLYEILRRPLVTEKTTAVAENNSVVFSVLDNATKYEIKHAVEKIYDVKVETVNTLNQKGKRKVFKGRQGKRNDVKKAYVKLVDGHSIDISAGVVK